MKRIAFFACFLSLVFAGYVNTRAGTNINSLGTSVTLSYNVAGQIRTVNSKIGASVIVEKIGGIKLTAHSWDSSVDNVLLAGVQAEYNYSINNSGNFTERVLGILENKKGGFNNGGWNISLPEATSFEISREGIVNKKLLVTAATAADDQDTGSFDLKISATRSNFYGQYQGNNQCNYGASKNILESISFIVSAPNLLITKSVTVQAPERYVSLGGSATDPVPGAILIYTLKYENTGGYKAANAEIIDLVPANTEFAQATGGVALAYKHGGDWDASYAPITPVDSSVKAVKWTLGEVAAGAKGEVILKVIIK